MIVILSLQVHIYLIFSEKYEIAEERVSPYQTRIALTISDFNTEDSGTYTCVSTNTVGKAEGTIRLYGKNR